VQIAGELDGGLSGYKALTSGYRVGLFVEIFGTPRPDRKAGFARQGVTHTQFHILAGAAEYCDDLRSVCP